MKVLKFCLKFLVLFAFLKMLIICNVNLYKFTSYKEEVDILRLNFIASLKDFNLKISDQVNYQTLTSFAVKDIKIKNFAFPKSFDSFKINVVEKNKVIIEVDHPALFEFEANYNKNIFGFINLQGSISFSIPLNKIETRVVFESEGGIPTKKNQVRIQLSKSKQVLKLDGTLIKILNVEKWFSELFEDALDNLMEVEIAKTVSSHLETINNNNMFSFYQYRNFYFTDMRKPIKFKFLPMLINLKENEGYSIGFQAQPLGFKKYEPSKSLVKPIFELSKGNIQYFLLNNFLSDFFISLFNFNENEHIKRDINYRVNLHTNLKKNSHFTIDHININYFNNKLNFKSEDYYVYGNFRISSISPFVIESDGKYNGTIYSTFGLYTYNYTDIHITLLTCEVETSFSGYAQYDKYQNTLALMIKEFESIQMSGMKIGESIKYKFRLENMGNMDSMVKLVSDILGFYKDFQLGSFDIMEEGRNKIRNPQINSEAEGSISLGYDLDLNGESPSIMKRR
jgi:hypothetical protein